MDTWLKMFQLDWSPELPFDVQERWAFFHQIRLYWWYIGMLQVQGARGHCANDDDLGKAEHRELQRSQVLSDIIWAIGSSLFDNNTIQRIFQLEPFWFQQLRVEYSAIHRSKNFKGYGTIPGNFLSLPQSPCEGSGPAPHRQIPEVGQQPIYICKHFLWETPLEVSLWRGNALHHLRPQSYTSAWITNEDAQSPWTACLPGPALASLTCSGKTNVSSHVYPAH